MLVTPCGSLAALAYLLPPGSTAVIMNFYHAETGANVQLDDAAFWNLDHVTLAYYPVGPEDYEGTSVRPVRLSGSLSRLSLLWVFWCLLQLLWHGMLRCARRTEQILVLL